MNSGTGTRILEDKGIFLFAMKARLKLEDVVVYGSDGLMGKSKSELMTVLMRVCCCFG